VKLFLKIFIISLLVFSCDKSPTELSSIQNSNSLIGTWEWLSSKDKNNQIIDNGEFSLQIVYNSDSTYISKGTDEDGLNTSDSGIFSTTYNYLYNISETPSFFNYVPYEFYINNDTLETYFEFVRTINGVPDTSKTTKYYKRKQCGIDLDYVDGDCKDKCNVVNGDNSCLGCNGVPNSGLIIDQCGVCGGDNDSYNNCSDCSVFLWGECYDKNTTNLYQQNKQLSGTIPTGIINLINLRQIRLNDNQLTGYIPNLIGNLRELDHLFLNNNQLSGYIPLELGNLKKLYYLYLNNNQLSGSIPPEIGNLINLESLNLSNNQLSGQIPSEICNQGNITLDLSNNQLCPPYPSCISQEDIDSQDTSECSGD